MQRDVSDSENESNNAFHKVKRYINSLDEIFDDDRPMNSQMTSYSLSQEYHQETAANNETKTLSHSRSADLSNIIITTKSSSSKDHVPTNKFSKMNIGDTSLTKGSMQYQSTDKPSSSKLYVTGYSINSPIQKEEGSNKSIEMLHGINMESDVRSPKRRREESDDKIIRQKSACLVNKYTVPEIPPFSSPEPSPSLSKNKNSSIPYTAPKRMAQQTANPLLSQSPSRPSPSKTSPPLQSTTSSRPLDAIYVNDVRYSILSQVGAGGTSKVFCVLSEDNKMYAIKQISFENADVQTYQMYLNEINLLQALSDSELIVKMYDHEINATFNLIYLVMEFGEVDMACLMAKERKSSLNLHFIRFYWKKMLQAVNVLHNSRIIHSDLKPANFMIVKGELRLIDFGIANKIANDTTNVHRDHNMGTPNYISPEALLDPGGGPGSGRPTVIGKPSDVWSLGCILYQMVYGHTPFQHLNMWQKIQCIPNPNYPIKYPDIALVVQLDPSNHTNHELHVPVSEELRNLLDGCLQRKPKDRLTIQEILAHPFFSQ